MSVKKLTGEEIIARVDTLPLTCLQSLAAKLLIGVSGVLCRVVLEEADVENFVICLEERELLLKQIKEVRPAVEIILTKTAIINESQANLAESFNKMVQRFDLVTKKILEMLKLPHIAKLSEGGA